MKCPLPNIREEDGIRCNQLKSGELGGIPLHRAQWSYLMTFMTFQFLLCKCKMHFLQRGLRTEHIFHPSSLTTSLSLGFAWVYSDKQLVKRNMTEEKSIAAREEVDIFYFTSVQ